MYRILICDDEHDIVSALKIYLTGDGYETLEAHDGEEALEILAREEVHLVLMDIMMPKMDGITAMMRLRQQCNLPVILITAKGEDNEKILGLNVGADDYITKPFHPAEVLARVRSHLRRYMQLGGGQAKPLQLTIGNIMLDDCTKQVMRDGEEINLTPTEYEILKLLMSHPRQVFSPAEIYELVWHESPLGFESTVAVHIRHLREKLEINPAEPRYLKVVWGRGYKMEAFRE